MKNKPSVITLGTFDGVHRGHLRILHRVLSRARAIRGKSVVLAFGMPPRHTGEKLQRPVLLTTLEEKLAIFKRFGISTVDVLVFDKKTASTMPEEFFQHTVLQKHHAKEMVVGPRVAFGRKRSGRLPLLRQLGKREGVKIHVVSSVNGANKSVSSRRIRALLFQGNVDSANRLLGYPYSIAGKVSHGDSRGRKMGFPTANIRAPEAKIMPPGVFWVKVMPAKAMPISLQELKKGADGLCNVGTRPTFTPKERELHCETYIFRGRAPQYGETIRIVFLRRIRSEMRFKDKQELIHQIQADLKRARHWAQS